MTRLELADKAAALINALEDHRAKVWAKGGLVRVYLRQDYGGKRGWQDVGHAEVPPSGTLELGDKVAFALKYERDTLAALRALPAAQAEELPAVTRPAGATAAAGYVDEDVRQFEASERAASARDLRAESR